MSTTISHAALSGVQPGMRLLTAADLAAMPEDLPSGPVSFELHHGRLVPMSPPAACHGNLQARVGSELILQGQKKGHGTAFAEVGVVLARNPDHVLGPDAAFVAARSFPVRESSEGYLETIPELVVEIRSKNDTVSEWKTKAGEYLKAGVQIVWLVNPENQTVTEHRPDAAPKVLGSSDSLRCEDIIPGFHLTLDDLFRS